MGICNHVVAMLFRVEYALRYGLTKPSSLCSWNVPNGVKINIKPTKFKELIYFDKSQYMKPEGSKQQIIENKKKLFTVMG